MSITYRSISLAKNLNFHGTTHVVLTSTSSTVKVNGNSKSNRAKILSSLTRDNKVPFYSILYIEKYCYDSLGMIGILCGYYPFCATVIRSADKGIT